MARSTSPRGISSRQSVTPDSELLPPSVDTTKVISWHPRIVLSDTRYDNAPCFLYIPDARADLVFVDYLPNLREVAQWPVWRRPAPAPPHSEAGPSFVVQDVPGKGTGMLAARLIRAGELIWEERPIYAARRTLSCAADQTDANGIFHRAALQGLAPAARTAFLRLANAYPAREFDAVPGILNTNCLELRIADPDAGRQMWTRARSRGASRPSRARTTRVRPPRTTTSPSRASRDSCGPHATSRPGGGHDRVRASDARRVGIRQLLGRLEGERFPPRIAFEQLREALDWAGEEGYLWSMRGS
ncbi:hypothetical protein A0H81_14572 [Grifola frondosa]|uniref:Uncharacterized protein n=1 Tax=Grifola frondosa TaxID=5627 RepID=A0A1C7LMN8_GRIFR|nr:hypothetical protein A0H81_14572 [Grifola frondosa]